MEKLRFRSLPVITNYTLPFSLDEQALADWLHDLAVEQDYNSAKKVFSSLRTLTRMGVALQLHVNILYKISAYLDELAGHLEKKYLDASFPLEPEQQAHVDIVAFAYAALSENYEFVGRQLLALPSKPLDKAHCLFLALDAAGKALLHMSQVYMQPYEGFWLFCHQIYLLAENNDLLNVACNLAQSPGQTIDAAYKHVLLFDLADSTQFRPREMKVVFNCLKRFSAQTILVHEFPEENMTGFCRLNLNQDQPPKALTVRQQHKDTNDRYVSSILAAKTMYQFIQQDTAGHGATKAINRILLIHVAKSLGMAQKRKHNRTDEMKTGVGLVGFNNIVSFLCKMSFSKTDNLMPTSQRDMRTAGKWVAPDLDLVPEGSEWMHQMQQNRKNLSEDSPLSKILKLSSEFSKEAGVWQTQDIEKNQLVDQIPTGEFQIIDSSAKGFHIVWNTPELKVNVGNIFAMPTVNAGRLEIGLIRRIGMAAQNQVELGIEVIGFESELIRLMRPGQKGADCWAILLPGIPALKQADSVVFNTSEYAVGEFITMRRGRKEVECRLHKLINATSAVNHAELLYP